MNSRFEALNMHRLIAGLTHNLNTPLNLILGYAQQLQKTYPEDPYLQKIIDAGLRIDQQLNDTSQALQTRLIQKTESIKLDEWWKREQSFLSSDLRIKREIVFESVSVPAELFVINSELMLSLVFENVIYSILELKTEPCVRIRISFEECRIQVIVKIALHLPNGMNAPNLIENIESRLESIKDSWGLQDWQDLVKLGTEPTSEADSMHLCLYILREQ